MTPIDTQQQQQQQQQNALILKLPSEILEHIIDLSSLITDRKEEQDEYEFYGWPYPEHNYINLKSIALCCRHLYTLCAPFLWRDKEFILPREDDTKSSSVAVQMATDILQKRALFQYDHYLGDYVRSLSRDLTNGPHYDLRNSKLMAQLVENLNALRIDFHPKARTEHYGVKYFVEYCPHLSELYLSNCKDTFDDFEALVVFDPPLISLTLTDCTIKQATLEKIAVKLKSTLLKTLLLQHVLIEPPTATKYTNTQLIDTTQFILHPFHYQNYQATAIPQHLFSSLLFKKHHLTHLALSSDSVDYTLVQEIVTWSPHLEKLATVIHDLNPFDVYRSIKAISQLSRLGVLSLAFSRFYPATKECEKLPCHAPAFAWSHFATSLPLLKLLYISTTRLLVYQDFIPSLLKTSPLLGNIMVHNVGLVTMEQQIVGKENEDRVRELYTRDVQHMTFDTEKWHTGKEWLYTYEQAKEKGFHCFDREDQVCFIKRFL